MLPCLLLKHSSLKRQILNHGRHLIIVSLSMYLKCSGSSAKCLAAQSTANLTWTAALASFYTAAVLIRQS
jgi:hypothetical protein